MPLRRASFPVHRPMMVAICGYEFDTLEKRWTGDADVIHGTRDSRDRLQATLGRALLLRRGDKSRMPSRRAVRWNFASSLCYSRDRRAFARLPQLAMSHHRRDPFFVRSMKSQRQSSGGHCLTRASSSPRSRSSAAQASGPRIWSSGVKAMVAGIPCNDAAARLRAARRATIAVAEPSGAAPAAIALPAAMIAARSARTSSKACKAGASALSIVSKNAHAIGVDVKRS